MHLGPNEVDHIKHAVGARVGEPVKVSKAHVRGEDVFTVDSGRAQAHYGRHYIESCSSLDEFASIVAHDLANKHRGTHRHVVEEESRPFVASASYVDPFPSSSYTPDPSPSFDPAPAFDPGPSDGGGWGGGGESGGGGSSDAF
jgi:hypothetical protein